jgi:hypothetical protein
MSSLSGSIAELGLHDDRDQPLRLGSAWASRPAVLVWLRHFG